LPEKIRGFGPVKLRNIAASKAEEVVFYEHFRAGTAPFLKAAE
jgi:indolepyruvate ferredoxin oxidoreductase